MKKTKTKPPARSQTTKKSPAPAAAQAFEEVRLATSDGAHVGYTWPVDRVPALARPGMVADVINDGCGRIETVLPEFCIVRMPDGTMRAATWGEVSLHDVRPDPAYLPIADDGKRIDDAAMRRVVAAYVAQEYDAETRRRYPRMFVGIEPLASDGNCHCKNLGTVDADAAKGD